MVYGHVRSKELNKFFVREIDGELKLICTDLPSFVSLPTANKIFFCGYLVRHFAKKDNERLTMLFSGSEVAYFDDLKSLKNASELEPKLLNKFVENLRKHAAQVSSKYIHEEEELLKHFQVIKSFFLTGNENLWIWFVTKLPTLDWNYEWPEAKRNRSKNGKFKNTISNPFCF